MSYSAHSVVPHRFLERWFFMSRIWRYS